MKTRKLGSNGPEVSVAHEVEESSSVEATADRLVLKITCVQAFPESGAAYWSNRPSRGLHDRTGFEGLRTNVHSIAGAGC
jgi:hypothetical protein